MELFNLGSVDWRESQIIYHALAHLGREALSLVSPAEPYVCIGYHQDAAQEVDLAFCRENDIPVFRREVGGGAVYLDGRQLFYQLIIRKDNPAAPLRKEAFYRKFLQPVIDVYRRIGIPAQYKPINDVIVGDRKISGTGVAEIGECIVFVGNLIVDFNYEMMSKVLKVPDEKFRDKMRKTLEDNLTTIRRELEAEKAEQWPDETLNGLLIDAFQPLFGAFDPGLRDAALESKMEELGRRMLTQEWLDRKGKRVPGRDVKIRAGLNVVQKMHKAVGGLIRADYEVRDGCYADVTISGDFFCYPAEAVVRLETGLEGRRTEDVSDVLRDFYTSGAVDTPGVGIDDWLNVLRV
ncbi:MAG: lipoate--protein ligase family protein [Proteobacteria bacterium]|nr:lipoate--protein ligase family protein [Pseudomonadota bacterium]